MTLADLTPRRFSLSMNGRSRKDYKQKLARKAAAAPGVPNGKRPSRGDEQPAAARVRQLSERRGSERTIFQSVAVTALQLIERVRCRTSQAATAALSLGQQEKLQGMETTLVATADALQSALSTQGAQMLDLCGEEENTGDEASWWFALTEAIEALEESAKQMDALAEGQPDDSVAADLSRLVSDLLCRQHTELLIEADQWIS